MANRPPRLERLFEEYSFPLWYITFNTRRRAALLANSEVHECFTLFCRKAVDREVHVGRYVLMPDHVHIFVAGHPEFDLGAWVRILKMSLSQAIAGSGPHWQEGAFDHLIRSTESYADKWEYVRQNPVDAGLVASPEDWPLQGELNALPFE
jgi:REP element-mobilizing transposase RayT